MALPHKKARIRGLRRVSHQVDGDSVETNVRTKPRGNIIMTGVEIESPFRRVFLFALAGR